MTCVPVRTCDCCRTCLRHVCARLYMSLLRDLRVHLCVCLLQDLRARLVDARWGQM